MPLYANQTRHSSVVTIKINSANDLKAAIKIGPLDFSKAIEVALGYNDLIVPAGESLTLADGTDATFIGVRKE